jgi:hypothetical protein
MTYCCWTDEELVRWKVDDAVGFAYGMVLYQHIDLLILQLFLLPMNHHRRPLTAADGH